MLIPRRYIALLLAGFLLGAGITWLWCSKQATKQENARVEQENKQTGAANLALNAEILRGNVLNARLAALDARYTAKTQELMEENATLTARLTTAGTNRLHIKGATCVRPDANSAETVATSLGDGTTLEISRATGQLIGDLRASIIRDQQKLRALQEYIATH